MNPEFYGVYNELYEAFERQGDSPGPAGGAEALARDARQIIERAAGEMNLSESLRPDARHFLLVNFHQFILMPALLASRRLSISYEAVMESLYSDARTILQTSRELAEERGREEISGHIILDSISRRWDSLQSTFYEFWDC